MREPIPVSIRPEDALIAFPDFCYFDAPVAQPDNCHRKLQPDKYDISTKGL